MSERSGATDTTPRSEGHSADPVEQWSPPRPLVYDVDPQCPVGPPAHRGPRMVKFGIDLVAHVSDGAPLPAIDEFRMWLIDSDRRL